MATSIQLPNGTEIETGDHLLVTCENSVVDQFEGENEMQAQRVEDVDTAYRVYFHDADGNEALRLSVSTMGASGMNLKTADGHTQVADVVSVEVRDDE